MADSNRTAVSVVAILAIVILIGLVVYFVTEEADDDVEIEFNGQLERDAPALAMEGPTARAAPSSAGTVPPRPPVPAG